MHFYQCNLDDIFLLSLFSKTKYFGLVVNFYFTLLRDHTTYILFLPCNFATYCPLERIYWEIPLLWSCLDLKMDDGLKDDGFT